MTQLPPYTEDDLDFLKCAGVDPWRHDGRNFERDYPQYGAQYGNSKRTYRAVNWPHVGVWIGLAGLLCGWICVINWAIPLVVKK